MNKLSNELRFKVLAVAFAIALGIYGLGSTGTSDSLVMASASGPTPSNTNAPSESNCTACHTSFPLNSGTGGVAINGLPARWTPGQQITFTVTTSQDDGVIYGYQMTALDSQGKRAGTLSVPSGNPQQSQIVTGIVGGESRQYAEHTIDGILPTVFGSKTWTVTWTAPAQPIGPVTFYAAGNASNSDGSTAGDYIYTKTAVTSSGGSPFDFDGDGKTDISIFRPAPGEWWYLRSSNGGNGALQFGTSTDKLVPADFTGDGKTDVAFWRPSTGQWFILRSEDLSFFAFPFGSNGDIPAPGDYDGDGKADAAVFRPATQTWFISKSTGGTDIVGFGAANDKPAIADYDGDRKADIAVFRSNGANGAEWWIRLSSTLQVFATQFGLSTDKAVQGDYTGDGKADVAFWRPSSGNWYVLRSEDFSFFAFPFGANGDVPVTGDYDGDGKIDSAVFRPANSTWYANRSTAGVLIQQFGQTGDLPLPNAFVP
mgnify:FL=1